MTNTETSDRSQDSPATTRPVRALIVIDGSERTGRVLELALDLAAKGLRLEAILLGVISEPPDGRLRGYGSFKRKDIHARLKDQMGSRAVAAVGRRLEAAGIVHRDRVEVGDPAASILRVAEEEACDLIILADAPPGLVRRWLPALTGLAVSTVGSAVAQAGALPVVTVK